jgi:hypothetical protein
MNENNDINIVRIYTNKYRNTKILCTYNNFFDNDIKLEIFYDKLIFKNIGKIGNKNISINKQGNRYSTILKIDWQDGLYYIDEEESDIDKLIVYKLN